QGTISHLEDPSSFPPAQLADAKAYPTVPSGERQQRRPSGDQRGIRLFIPPGACVLTSIGMTSSSPLVASAASSLAAGAATTAISVVLTAAGWSGRVLAYVVEV